MHQSKKTRTTLAIDDDVYAEVKKYAEDRSMTASQAINHLLRRGLQYSIPIVVEDGFLVFDPPPDAPRITTELVRKLESEW